MYNALIVGAGQIAGGYDSKESTDIFTHAHAYINNSNINLLGFYDIDYTKSQKMAEKWDTKAIKSLKDINSNIDIISICTPDNTHLEMIKKTLEFAPQIIFLEKPISNNINDFNKIKKISETTPILIDYTRRFIKEFQELAVKIKNGEFGAYQTGSGYYGKGFYHNGSHMKDLLTLLLGKILSINPISQINDYSDKDLTQTAILNFDRGNFFMQGTNSNEFEIFEIDLIFTKARIKILDGGGVIQIYEIKAYISDWRIFMKIMFYANDPGGANAIKPLLNPLEGENDIFIYGNNSALKILPNCKEYNKNMKKIMPDIVITGTSANEFTEKIIWEESKKLDIKTIAILDHWCNYGVRFSKYGLNEIEKFDKKCDFLPDYIIVMDNFAKQIGR